jgi:hypothetical protein
MTSDLDLRPNIPRGKAGSNAYFLCGFLISKIQYGNDQAF